jgi:hypothetical protein
MQHIGVAPMSGHSIITFTIRVQLQMTRAGFQVPALTGLVALSAGRNRPNEKENDQEAPADYEDAETKGGEPEPEKRETGRLRTGAVRGVSARG